MQLSLLHIEQAKKETVLDRARRSSAKYGVKAA